MPEDTQTNSLQSKIDTDENIKKTDRYMEPNNDIIEDYRNENDNTKQQLVEH